MKYLKLFKLDSDYQAFIEGEEFITPNVSYTLDTKISYFNSGNIIPSEPDFSKEYLTFTALEDSTIVLKQLTTSGISNPNNTNLSYSIDGQPWEIWDFNNPISLNMNQSVRLKGYNENGFSDINPQTMQGYVLTFSFSTGKLNVSGNIMSLLYDDDFKNKLEIPSQACFGGLFGDVYGFLTNTHNNIDYIIDAKDLILPATILTNECYFGMFYNCTSLTTAPALPATTLAGHCYVGMFQGCTSLTTAPELPATTLANSCYRYMFYECTSLNYIKMLATNINADNCLNDWVVDVSPTGTFVKSLGVYIENGTSGIPDGWTVEFILPNNIIMNGWNELYPDVEAFNLVNNTDVDIVFNDYDSGDINLNAYSKINIMPDKYTNLRTQSQFVCDIILSGEDKNIVIMDNVYRNDYYNVQDFIDYINNKYNLHEIISWNSISVVIKQISSDGILPNGWNDLYENVKPFTIVNKTNRDRCMFRNDSGEYVFEINVNEECNIDDFDSNNLKPGNEFKIDILLSNNSENIVLLSMNWGTNETFNDLGGRINDDYDNLLSNFNNFSIVIYDEIEPK